VLTAIIRQLTPAELAKDHARVNKKYQNLIRDIQAILVQPKELRNTPRDICEQIKNRFNSLLEHQLDAPIVVVRLFERHFGKSVENILYTEEVRHIISLKTEASSKSPRLPWSRLLSTIRRTRQPPNADEGLV
jgi:hypothetical protein